MRSSVRAAAEDRFLPVDQAGEELAKFYGISWSRKSINRMIKSGSPFTWIEGVHYLRGTTRGRNGAGICSINVDAIRRSWVKQ